MITRTRFMLIILFLVSLTTPLSSNTIQAQDNAPPYLYYYSQLDHAFIVERADGSDSHLLGADVMPATDNRIHGDGWSASGDWFMWTSVDGTIEGNQTNFMASLWVINSTTQQPLSDFDDLPIINAWWSSTADILTILVGTEGMLYTTDTQEASLLFYDVAKMTWLDSKTSFQLARGLYYEAWSPDGTNFFIVSYGSDEQENLSLHILNQQGDLWYSDSVTSLFSDKLRWLSNSTLAQTNSEGDLFLRQPDQHIQVSIDLTRPVISFSFSPDNKTLLVVTEDNFLHRYSLMDGVMEKNIVSNTSTIEAWSPDSQMVLVYANENLSLQLLRLDTLMITNISLEEATSIDSHFNIPPIWSDKNVIFQLRNGVFRYDWTTNRVEQIGEVSFNSMSQSPDGRTRLSLDNYCAPMEITGLGMEPVCLEDMTTGEMNFVPPHSGTSLNRYGPVLGDWSPDNEWVIIREHENIGAFFMPYYSVATRTGTQHRELTNSVYAGMIGWLPSHIDVNKIPAIESNLPSLTILAHNNFAIAVAWSPDGSTIASGGQDGAVHLWSAKTGENRWTFNPHANNTGTPQYIAGLGWTIDGLYLGILSYSFNRAHDQIYNVQVWDINAQSMLFESALKSERNTIEASFYIAPCFSLNSELFGQFIGVDMANQQAGWLDFGRFGSSANQLGAISIPEETYAQIYYWETGEQFRVNLEGSDTQSLMGNARLSNDGQRLAFVSDNYPLLAVWDVATGDLVDEFAVSGVSLDFSPDGKRIAVATSYYIKVWDLPE